MTEITEKFFSLLRYSIGEQQVIPTMELDEWEAVNTMAMEQSLTGVFYQGVSRLAREVKLPEEVTLTWYFQNEQIIEANKSMNTAAVKVLRKFRRAGYGCCLLKGQGNALMYPHPSSRMPGDIDVWVNGPVRKLVGMAKKSSPECAAVYHHIDFPPIGDISVEVHYRPSFANNLIHNRRMQRWFLQMVDKQCNNKVELPDGAGVICMPTDAFNRIYQMSHISHHIFQEGIGLRQVLDYYYLLKRGVTTEQRRDEEKLLRRFGLYGVAAAVMYILNEVFGMEKDQLLVPPDERKGRFLLNEILMAGNFGHYDKRLQNSTSRLSKNVQRLRRDLRFVTYFPSECLWEPVFRWYNFFWRVWYNRILSYNKDEK